MTSPRRVLAVIALPLAATLLSACSTAQENVRDESGAITEANDKASVFDMKIGDCFDDPGSDADEFETLPAVPCGDEHDYEVYAARTMESGDYPGQDEVEKQSDTFCADEFSGFVGVAYDDSELDFTYLYPTTDTWSMDDREITCLVISETPTTGSLKGSKR